MDRIPGMTPWEDLDDRWAFYDEPGQGTGSEELFSTVHVYLMGMAIELLNIGLKQSEVIFFLKHMRPTLEEVFKSIHSRNSQAPFSGAPNNGSAIHSTAWMLVRREETQEQYPLLLKKIGNKKQPLFMVPLFFNGFDEVSEHFARASNSHRHVILIEIADLALTLPIYLNETSVARRGRPSTKQR